MAITDPVCKMTIEEKDAVGSSIHEGNTYHFCSEACKDKFDENPATYTGEEVPVSKKEFSEKVVIHTCPMHPEVRQEGPGSSAGRRISFNTQFH